MKHLTVLIAALCLAPTALAESEPECERYDRIIAAAPSDMRSLRSEPTAGSAGIFATTEQIPGYRCMVAKAASPIFACMAAPISEAAARARYAQDAAKLRACFTDWTEAEVDEFEHPLTPEDTLLLQRPGDGGVYKIGAVVGWVAFGDRKEWGAAIAITWVADPVGV